MGYSKNIAVIKGLKDGFSADGGALTGLIKAELYGRKLCVEVTLINFAPLTEGRYVCAISDGAHTITVEGDRFEGEAELDTSAGFAALICYVNVQVYPVASAICGGFHGEALTLKREVEKLEKLKVDDIAARDAGVTAESEYSDEAIAEENYYEYAEADESADTVLESKKQEAGGSELRKDETTARAVEGSAAFVRGGYFYERVKGEVEGLLKTYPKERALERLIENSKWVRIDYGDGKYYVFGVLFDGDKPVYIGYGVPTDGGEPPESLKGLASFVPRSADGGESGYWIMYQDAGTGASLKIEHG